MLRGWLSMCGYMNTWRPLLAAILLLFSSASFADTYPAEAYSYSGWPDWKSTYSAACSSWDQVYPAYAPYMPQGIDANGNGSCIGTGGPVPPVTIARRCSYGGTLSGTSCINAPACPTGQVRNATTGACEDPPVACPTGQYNFQGTCIAIPDCNANNTTGGNFFNVNTNQCETAVGSLVLCIGTNDKYCPTTGDCQTAVCANKPEDLAAQIAAKNATLEAARASAANAVIDAKAAANSASATAADKQAAVDTIAAAKAAALAASKDVNATPEQRSAAASQFAKLSLDLIHAKADAANASSASSRAGAAAGDAEVKHSVINDPSIVPGNAKVVSDQIGQSSDAALKALGDALKGYTNGSGTTPADQNNPCPPGQNCDGTANGNVVGKGTAAVPPSDGNAGIIAAKQGELQGLMSGIKMQFAGLIPSLQSGGTLSCSGAVTLLSGGAIFNLCLGTHANEIAFLGNVVFFIAAVVSLMVVMG